MRRATLVGLSIALMLSSGCFSFGRRARFSDTERLPVKFETPEAAKTFYAAFDEPAVRHSDWTITVSPLLLMRVDLVLHEVEWYNHLVRRADINGDSVITEQEALLLPLPKEEVEEE